jgi:3-isopropylmalate/(R)-2-methylmalate dehydratase large subunit
MLDKVWDAHLVRAESAEAPAVLYVDLHLVHEVTSPQAFAELAERGRRVRRPDRTVATMDHSTPTAPPAAAPPGAAPQGAAPQGAAPQGAAPQGAAPQGANGRSAGLRPLAAGAAAEQLAELERNCQAHGIALYPLGDERQGIVHVIGPELGLTQPGMTIVCGDSHTSTHGAFGALAFGIGSSEVAHVLATQCLLQRKPKTFAVRVEGRLRPGVTAKDLVLGLIAELGVGGATGHAVEYRGPAIEALDMEGRMTVCNMSIEAGARAGMIAPDETTGAYLAGRPFAPPAAELERAVEGWRELRSDDDAPFDRTFTFDASSLEPMVTFGTHPGMAIPIDGEIPMPWQLPDAATRLSFERALDYMGLQPGLQVLGHPVDVVFLGSCTNGRLSDLRAAAALLRERRIDPTTRMLVVPGSQRVKREAEAEGLDEVFRRAGAEWREPGCSMCIAMNGDRLHPGHYAVSTSNRNFEGRQGPGGRTFLASPLTAAASALAGRVADPRAWMD